MSEQALHWIAKAKQKRLPYLDLGHCGLTELPPELFELDWLEELVLSNNELSNVSSLATLTNLIYLSLNFNQLSDVSPLAALTSLTSLNLYNNQLSDVSPLAALAGLNSLSVGSNQLSDVSPLAALTDLTYLDLGYNQLSDVSPLAVLTGLTSLNLERNQLSDVSPLATLTALTSLNLERNQLSDVSPLAALTGLTSLGLRYNQLSDVSPLAALTGLTSLGLRYNQLSDVSPLAALTALTSLDLDNNEFLTSLKSIIPLFEKGTTIYTLGCPITEPPQEIIEQGNAAILDYFKKIEQGTEKLYEAKLIIVGEGNAGKTTLANKLIDLDYQLRERELSTEGIDILQWQFEFEQNKTFYVNLWDFGGQEIYHATHQFFLTNRSLYILVADDRAENTNFFYWLQIVELLSDKSPIVIIKNEKHDLECQIDEEYELRGLFKSFQCTLATNLATNRGLASVQKELQHQLQNLPHIGTKFPKTWADVRRTLENDQRNYIDHKIFLTICDEKGLTERESKDHLIQFLHDLGVCLHFKDDALLKKTVILNPEWGTDAVYKVLDNEKVINNQGQFTKQDLAIIWQAEKYDDMHDELLQLMMNFKLCYKLTYCKAYIAPQLLSRKKPQYQLNPENNLLLRYSYKFMPKGMMTQFIVAMHKFIAKRQSLVWRNGVILDKDETRAEVIEQYAQREVNIRIQGKMPRELAYFITSKWDEIHDSYHNLKVQKLIPCNCVECHHSQQPYFHDYKTLLHLKSKGIQASQCSYSGEMVNINQLLGEVFKKTDTDTIQKPDKTSETHIHNHIHNNNRNFNNVGHIEDSNINQGDNVQQLAQQLANLTPEQQAKILEVIKNKG
ncbi:COR domain-containing protein [Candidatus Albibeggiatoa sp. nov. NOAA]|uniref:COR domain-containing protein n=1 Tax=Candidatus Albibeggiatoa sp. nov. NOAA TaxID=3162724 RepID=UPI0032FFD0EE|nr:leucine-rich repeat domain-containing protein [Thiotrichaceae bacterium]